jgi:hypothetical protein
MRKIGKTRSERGGAKRRRTVLFQDGLGALSVAAFLFLGATIREVNLLMALGSFFAGFAVLDYWQGRRSLRRLRVSRKTPDAIFAGKPFEVEIEIDASARRSTAWGIVVEDEWTLQERERELLTSAKRSGLEEKEEIGGKEKKKRRGKMGKKTNEAAEEARPAVVATARPTAYFPRVKGGERRRERYCGVVARRGVRRLATLTASTRFPCGFFRSSERFDAPSEIVVFPKIGALTERWNAAFNGARREATVATVRISRLAGETATVRDWRPDDSKRAIHWRATAKRDKLQARDFEKRENTVKILILDLFFNEKNDAENGAVDREEQNGETGRLGRNSADGINGEKAQKGRKTKKTDGDGAQETARRSNLVEKAVSFSATLIDSWARSNDAKFLLAINGDEPTSLKENGGDWRSRVESGGGALRRALTRLATVEAPRRDRWNETISALDPRVLANAQVFIVAVEGRSEKSESSEEASGAGVSARRIGERWSGANLIDVSAADFDDYIEF